MLEGEAEKLLHMEERIHERLINQEEAVAAISEAIRRSRAGLKDPRRPIGSFMFLGPTGVGKTETAKALAQVYFGSEKAMVRVDMSEYQTPDSINRLIGPPPGKAGFELGGQLTEAVRRRPFTVILLDELEKANKRLLETTRKLEKSYEKIKSTNSFLKTIIYASQFFIIATDNQGKIFIFNDAAKKIFGRESADVIGNGIESVIIPIGEANTLNEIDEHLMINNDFPRVLKFIEHVNEIVMQKHALFLVSIDSRAFDPKELALLERNADVIAD